jgi:hypothetical protein
MYPRQNVDLLILFVQQILQIPYFCLQSPHSFLQRLGVPTRKSAATQFVACLAFETDIGALCTTWMDTITANLFASASITGLGNTTLRTAANLDHFHR